MASSSSWIQSVLVQLSVRILVYSAPPEPACSALFAVWQLMILVRHLTLNCNIPGVLRQCCMPVSTKQRVTDNDVCDAAPLCDNCRFCRRLWRGPQMWVGCQWQRKATLHLMLGSEVKSFTGYRARIIIFLIGFHFVCISGINNVYGYVLRRLISSQKQTDAMVYDMISHLI